MSTLRLYSLQRLTRAVERLETELVRLDERGVFFSLEKPTVLHFGGRPWRRVRVQARAAMRNGIAFGLTVDFDVVRIVRSETYLVIREEQHLRASVFGEGEVTRYESGHRTHKQHPHMHGTWCALHNVKEPDLGRFRSMSITRFVETIDAWRAEHATLLPLDPPPLGRIRS